MSNEDYIDWYPPQSWLDMEKRIKEQKKIESESSIFGKIHDQYNKFIDSLTKSSIPIKISEINDDIFIHINKVKKKSIISKYDDFAGYDSYLTRLIIPEEEYINGIINYVNDPTKIIFTGESTNINPVDENGNSKYIFSRNSNYSLISVRYQGNVRMLYEINPRYQGEVRYTSTFNKEEIKPINVPCLYKNNDEKQYVKGILDINSISNKLKSTRRRTAHSSVIGIDQIKKLTFVKINSIEQSVKLFGYGDLKKDMLESNSHFKIANILINFKCKKDDKIRDIVEICYKNKTYKFLGEEVEFVYPDISILTKGYHLPKDRTIIVGIDVKIKNDKGTSLKKGDKVHVISKSFKDYYKVRKDSKDYLIRKNQLKVC